MSCDAATSPYNGNLGDPFDSKPNASNDVDLDLTSIADFNASFDGLDQGSVDPHHNTSNAGSPSFDLSQPMSPEPATYYPNDFGSTPSSPYFQSIEPPPAAPLFPSPLRNQFLHRRSVSEPPDGAIFHHRPEPQGMVTFHRDGHKLGDPPAKSSAYTPPIKKVKQSRQQPYPRATDPPQMASNRYHLRRANTNPMQQQRPPTSAPPGMMMRPPPPPPPHYQQAPHMPFAPPMMQEEHFVSSRVCTPAPEPAAVDPMLMTPSSAPMVPQMGSPTPMMGGTRSNPPATKAVVIKLGVDELRAMIMEVVQKAVEGLHAAKEAKAGSDQAAEEEIGENIVVAGSADVTNVGAAVPGDDDQVMSEIDFTC